MKFLMIVCVLLFWACGDSNSKVCDGDSCVDAECKSDNDCDGLVCEANQCIAPCESTDFCAASESCVERQNGGGGYCAQTATTNNDETQTENGDDDANVEDAENNASEEVGIHYFAILDTTEDGCDVDDPGTDLQYVRIRENQNVVGFGRVTSSFFGSDPNEHMNIQILNQRSTQQCVDDFSPNSVVSLGCDGAFIFEAVDRQGVRFDLIPGVHTVEVGEYGLECGGSNDDSYEVYLCIDPDRAGAGELSTCYERIGIGSGIRSFQVLRN